MAEQTAIQADAFAGTAHQRPRPTRYDKEIRRAAAEALIPELERWGGFAIEGVDRERLIDTLASGGGDDGYKLARELERDGYDPDTELVEILDCFDAHTACSAAVRVWLAETGANPRLAVGTVVSIPVRTKEHEGLVGEIVSIDTREGAYLVYCAALGHVRAGLGTHGLIFPWEEVEAQNAVPLDCAGGDAFDGDPARVLGQGTV